MLKFFKLPKKRLTINLGVVVYSYKGRRHSI